MYRCQSGCHGNADICLTGEVCWQEQPWNSGHSRYCVWQWVGETGTNRDRRSCYRL